MRSETSSSSPWAGPWSSLTAISSSMSRRRRDEGTVCFSVNCAMTLRPCPDCHSGQDLDGNVRESAQSLVIGQKKAASHFDGGCQVQRVERAKSVVGPD